MSSFVCWTCRVSRGNIHASPPWQARRALATLQKRQPGRMTLSPKVANTAMRGGRDGKSPKPGPGPFGGLNRTEVDVRKLKRQVRPKRIDKGSQTDGAKSKTKSNAQPFKALKMQRALAPISYEKRAEVKESINNKMDRETFASYPLLPIVKDSIGPQALQGREDAIPSPIQRLAIPALLGSRKGIESSAKQNAKQHFLVAAETGSGKTLAYLLPVIDALKRAELKEKQLAEESMPSAGEVAEGQKSKSEPLFTLDRPRRPQRDAFSVVAPVQRSEPDPDTGRPKAIILVPTAELVDQVGSVVKSLSHTVKYRTALLSASYSGQVIRNRLFSPGGVDVVVSTPHLLSSIVEADPNVLARVTHVVVDEADSLLDRSFGPITQSILSRAEPSMRQLILCSATIPRNLDGFLSKNYPDMTRLATPNLHAIPRRVQLSVVDIEGEPYKSNRNLACADTIFKIGTEASIGLEQTPDRVLRVIVFVNERETTAAVAKFLKLKGIDAVAFNRDATDRQTTDILSDFTGVPIPRKDKGEKDVSSDRPIAENTATAKSSQPHSGRHLANVKVLVMTDIGSRGIDTLEVRNVILYDVPHTSIDFIHRLGRVGRMGRRGRGFVLVGKGDRKDIVREVRTGMFMGKALI